MMTRKGGAGRSTPPHSAPPLFSTHPSRADTFTESVIREMTRLALQHNAINLAQGFPDFSCPQELKAAFTDKTRALILNTPNNPL